MTIAGKLIGVGTGPGDPELLTLKAVNAIRSADVLAYFAKRGNNSNARRTVQNHLDDGLCEVPLLYPVTTELPKDSAEYQQQIDEFYEQSAAVLKKHLLAGETVVVLSEGDPLFYGSYLHLHARLAHLFPTEVVPGITAMSGCWSQAGASITQGNDVLSVIPGTLAEDSLTARLADTEAAVVMKVGRNLAKIRRALTKAGRIGTAIYVERGTMEESQLMPLTEKADDIAPYFSIILVPGCEGRS